MRSFVTRVMVTVGVALATISIPGVKAEAVLVQWDIADHPITTGWVPNGPAGILLMPPATGDGVRGLSITSGTFTFDTDTGLGVMSGQAIDTLSGDLWRFNSTMSGLNPLTFWAGPGPNFPASPSPYPEMFDDMQADGYCGFACGASLAFTDLTFDIDTDVFSPAYTGPRSMIEGPTLADGVYVPGLLKFRYLLDPAFYPGSEWDLFGIEMNTTIPGGTVTYIQPHLLLRNQRVVPEPMTGALFGMGTLLAGFTTRRRRRVKLPHAL